MYPKHFGLQHISLFKSRKFSLELYYHKKRITTKYIYLFTHTQNATAAGFSCCIFIYNICNKISHEINNNRRTNDYCLIAS